jgi:hypothetical protein
MLAKILHLTLHRASHDVVTRTLGVILSPAVAHSAQLRHTLQYAKELTGKFRNSRLSQKAKLMAVDSVIGPAVLYPLGNTFFSDNDIKPIESVILQQQCAALGLNRNFPCTILHGPTFLGGIGIHSSQQKSHVTRLTFFFIIFVGIP